MYYLARSMTRLIALALGALSFSYACAADTRRIDRPAIRIGYSGEADFGDLPSFLAHERLRANLRETRSLKPGHEGIIGRKMHQLDPESAQFLAPGGFDAVGELHQKQAGGGRLHRLPGRRRAHGGSGRFGRGDGLRPQADDA